MVEITTDQHFANVSLAITDKDGQPAEVDGLPIWATSDETILRAIPDADGMGGTIDTVGPGTARITVTADADLGGGIVTITGVSEDIIVTAGVRPATQMVLTLGAPASKVAPLGR